MTIKIRYLSVFLLSALLLVGCGDDSSPTSPGPTQGQSSMTSNGLGSTSLSSPMGSTTETGTSTVADVLSNAGGLRGQQVKMQGSLLRELGGGVRAMFADSTGEMPMRFPETSMLPPLNVPLRVTGTVGDPTVDYPAEINVTSYEQVNPFSCEEMIEVRARFSDPGFALGDIVGYYLSYRGVPAGNKILEVTWDEGNSSGAVEKVELGPGTPRDDGLFDFEGVATHQYPGVRGTQTKNVRANLTIEGVEGQCSRVREVTVSPGSGPGSAGGGSLRVSVADPVQSGSRFDVRATVENKVSKPIDMDLLFEAPTNCTFDSKTLPSGCIKHDRVFAECKIKNVQPGERVTTAIPYDAPLVASPQRADGSVTLLTKEYSPVATYSTTIKP